MASGERRAASGERRAASGEWRAASGSWQRQNAPRDRSQRRRRRHHAALWRQGPRGPESSAARNGKRRARSKRRVGSRSGQRAARSASGERGVGKREAGSEKLGSEKRGSEEREAGERQAASSWHGPAPGPSLRRGAGKHGRAKADAHNVVARRPGLGPGLGSAPGLRLRLRLGCRARGVGCKVGGARGARREAGSRAERAPKPTHQA